jgi:DNA segregation ATPase FtsK/SpoIIIE, S-DNA-T family
MDAHMIVVLIAGTAGLGVVVWVLAKIGQVLIKIAEALAAAAVVAFTVWLLIKAGTWAIRQALTHWRISLSVLAVGAWWHWGAGPH